MLEVRIASSLSRHGVKGLRWVLLEMPEGDDAAVTVAASGSVGAADTVNAANAAAAAAVSEVLDAADAAGSEWHETFPATLPDPMFAETQPSPLWPPSMPMRPGSPTEHAFDATGDATGDAIGDVAGIQSRLSRPTSMWRVSRPAALDEVPLPKAEAAAIAVPRVAAALGPSGRAAATDLPPVAALKVEAQPQAAIAGKPHTLTPSRLDRDRRASGLPRVLELMLSLALLVLAIWAGALRFGWPDRAAFGAPHGPSMAVPPPAKAPLRPAAVPTAAPTTMSITTPTTTPAAAPAPASATEGVPAAATPVPASAVPTRVPAVTATAFNDGNKR